MGTTPFFLYLLGFGEQASGVLPVTSWGLSPSLTKNIQSSSKYSGSIGFPSFNSVGYIQYLLQPVRNSTLEVTIPSNPVILSFAMIPNLCLNILLSFKYLYWV